jgi:hypothetical protein
MYVSPFGITKKIEAISSFFSRISLAISFFVNQGSDVFP